MTFFKKTNIYEDIHNWMGKWIKEVSDIFGENELLTSTDAPRAALSDALVPIFLMWKTAEISGWMSVVNLHILNQII